MLQNKLLVLAMSCMLQTAYAQANSQGVSLEDPLNLTQPPSNQLALAKNDATKVGQEQSDDNSDVFDDPFIISDDFLNDIPEYDTQKNTKNNTKNNAKDGANNNAQNNDAATNDNVADASEDTTSSDEDAKNKKGWTTRLYEKYFGEDDLANVEKISVLVNLVDAALTENIQAALSEISVDDFADYETALPRIRSVAKEAADAVGFYNATFKFEKLNANVLDVTITENAPVKITRANIKIIGAQKSDALQKILTQKTLAVGNNFNHGHYNTLKQQIEKTAGKLGFFKGYWVSSQVQVRLPENTATVDLVYNAGQRFNFGHLTYEDTNGNPYLLTAENAHDIDEVRVNEEVLKQLMPFKEGEPFNQEKLTQFINNLLATQYFKGVDVRIKKPQLDQLDRTNSPTTNTTVTAKTNRNNLKNNNTKTSASKKTVTSKVVFSDAKVAAANQPENNAKKLVLNNTHTTTDKNIATRKDVQNNLAPIVLILDSSKPNSAEIGIGYGTDTSYRIRGKLSRNLFNSKGHKTQLSMEASRVKQALEFSYQVPFKNPINDTLTYFAGYEHEKRESGIGSQPIDIDKLTAGLQRNIKTNDWQHRMSLTYYFDSIDTRGINITDIDDLPARFKGGGERQQLLLLGYGIDRTFLRGGLYPTDGIKQYAQAEVGIKRLLSDTNIAILRAGISGLYSFGEGNYHQLIGRVDGASIASNSFKAVPYNHRFFAGGDRSIRGFDYKSLSPENDSGFLIGGQHLLVGSAEYNYLFADNWRLAGFVDAGNAYNNAFSNPTKIGAGVGLRWLSPVGLVRIDLAAGVSEESPPIRLHFFIGPPL